MRKLFILFIIFFIIVSLLANERQKVGLVLSGGGAKGLAHIGMLKVIDEIGIKVDYIFGTSIGAIVGGLYASGYTAVEIEKLMLEMSWNELLSDAISRAELHPSQKKWLPTGNFYFRLDENFIPGIPQGMLLGNKIHLQLAKKTWHVANIDDFSKLAIPFLCVATDIETGELVLLGSGTLADAMRASSSMPTLFMPFELNERLLIDGGVSQNFPVDIAKEYGCDFIFGLRTNTKLSGREDLNNPLSILNQTLNIGMLHRQSMSEQYADLIISPKTDDFSAIDFNKAPLIIKRGYDEAMKHYDQLSTLAESLKLCDTSKGTISKTPEKIKISDILVKNNMNMSGMEIRNYLNLKTGESYTRDEIIFAFEYAYATEYFDQIYPNIINNGDEYTLIVNVKEKERKHLGVNVTYNNHDQFVAGFIIRLKNVLLKKSNLIINAEGGGKYALEIDYTKAFLKDHNIYYRIFPYIKEDRVYFYDNKYHRTHSSLINEYGVTTGIGFHIFRDAIFEPYAYSYRMEYKRDIAESNANDKLLTSSGAGIKLYYENLNDFPFYTKGFQLFSKYSTAKDSNVSNIGYQKWFTSLLFAQPITKKTSVLVTSELGTYFKSKYIPEDPFFIGGIDNFLGLNPKEVLAPHFQKHKIGLRLRPYDNLFFDINMNVLNYGNTYSLPSMNYTDAGVGLVLGYKSVFGPARIGFAINDNNRKFSYISIGYDFDAFMLSRR